MQQIYNLVVAMHLSAFDKQFLKPYAKLFFVNRLLKTCLSHYCIIAILLYLCLKLFLI